VRVEDWPPKKEEKEEKIVDLFIYLIKY